MRRLWRVVNGYERIAVLRLAIIAPPPKVQGCCTIVTSSQISYLLKFKLHQASQFGALLRPLLQDSMNLDRRARERSMPLPPHAETTLEMMRQHERWQVKSKSHRANA